MLKTLDFLSSFARVSMLLAPRSQAMKVKWKEAEFKPVARE
jgi:hypothetical protein